MASATLHQNIGQISALIANTAAQGQHLEDDRRRGAVSGFRKRSANKFRSTWTAAAVGKRACRGRGGVPIS